MRQLTKLELIDWADVEPFLAQFDALDTDGSGVLTAADLAAMVAQKQAQQHVENAHLWRGRAPEASFDTKVLLALGCSPQSTGAAGPLGSLFRTAVDAVRALLSRSVCTQAQIEAKKAKKQEAKEEKAAASPLSRRVSTKRNLVGEGADAAPEMTDVEALSAGQTHDDATIQKRSADVGSNGGGKYDATPSPPNRLLKVAERGQKCATLAPAKRRPAQPPLVKQAAPLCVALSRVA